MRKLYQPALALLILIGTLEPLGETMYGPALTAIGQSLHSAETPIKMTMLLFVITFSFSQFCYGLLSDRYGRRNTLLLGTALFTIGTLVCGFASHFDIFLIGRGLQGLGAGAGALIAKAMIRDSFAPDEQRRAFSYVVCGTTAAILLGPVLGGYIVSHYNWNHVFHALSTLSACTFLLCFFTLPRNTDRKTFGLGCTAIQHRSIS